MTNGFVPPRRKRLLAVFLSIVGVAGAIIGSAGTVRAAPERSAKACGPVMFVVPGWRDTAPKLMNQEFAPRGATIERIVYPNSAADINLYTNVDAGVANLKGKLYELYVTKGCGLDTKVYIVGFSLGALVAGTVLETEPPGRNIQGVLFADGRRQPGESNHPNDPGGLVGHLPAPGPGGTGNRPIDAFKYPTLSLCNGPDAPGGADVICFGGSSLDSYFKSHPYYSFEVAKELAIHGEGPYPHNLRNRVIP